MTTTNNTALDSKNERIAREIETIKAQVSQTSVGARLPERIFVNVFLPFFAGEHEAMLYDVDLNTWLNVAGSPFSEVEIINDSTGKTLFSVPAIYDREAVNAVNTEGPSIAHIVASSNQLSNVHPSQGEAFLNRALTGRAMVMSVPANVRAHAGRWNEIFKRYNRPAMVAMDVNPTEQQAADDGPDFDFVPL